MSLTEILPGAQSLPVADKLRLIRILAEEVEADARIAPFEVGRSYELLTPTFEPGAAEILLQAIEADARQ